MRLRTSNAVAIIVCMKLWFSTTILTLAACSNAEVNSHGQWKESYSAAECKELMSLAAIQKRCGEGIQARILDDPSACIPYSSSQRMSGIWVHGFEYSAFFAGARSWHEVSHQAFDPRYKLTWLSGPATFPMPSNQARMIEGFSVSRVELIGKRSLCASGYGHLGGSEHEVIVERFLTIAPDEAPSPQFAR